MTFNLRFATPLDGPNEWEFRKELVADIIKTHLPDLLGTQEGTVPQLEYLEAGLPGYLPLTAHRDVDRTCQYPTIVVVGHRSLSIGSSTGSSGRGAHDRTGASARTDTRDVAAVAPA